MPDTTPDLTFGFLNLPDIDQSGTISAAATAGFRSVGLRLTGRRPQESYPFDVLAEPQRLRDAGERLRQTGLRLSNISSFHHYPDVGAEHTLPVLDAAASLDADMMIASCYDPDHDAFALRMERYADAAAARGLRIALELVSYSAMSRLADARRLLDRLARPNFGLLLDPLHLVRAAQDFEDFSGFASSEIFFAQLCDASAAPVQGMDLLTEAKTARLYPGEGELPLKAFLDALPAGTELEPEVPERSTSMLPPEERARLLMEKCLSFLEGNTGSQGQQ